MPWRTFAEITSSQATVITEDSGDQVYCIPFSWLDDNFDYLKNRLYTGSGSPVGVVSPEQDKAWYLDTSTSPPTLWFWDGSSWSQVNVDTVDGLHASDFARVEAVGKAVYTEEQLRNEITNAGSNETQLVIADSFSLTDDLTVPENIALVFPKGKIITVPAKSSTASETIATGDGSTTSFSYTVNDPPIKKKSITISYTIGGTAYTATDDGNGNISGTNCSGTVDYLTGDVSLTFSTAPDNGTDITIDYTPTYLLTINGNIKAGLWQIFDGDGWITGNPKIEAVYPEWFGAVGDGETDDTSAIQKAIKIANGKILKFSSKTYSVSLIDFSTYCPAFIDAKEAILKANTSVSYLVYIENPHGKINTQFVADFGLIDSNNLADIGLKIKGGQRMYIKAKVKNSKSHGILLEADDGYGIYYSIFHFDSQENNGDGIRMVSLSASMKINSNVFFGSSILNTGNGWYMDYAQNTFIGCEAEKNDGYGFYVNHCYQNDFIGGYSEHNHQGYASSGTSDGTDDESFYLDTNAYRVKIIGGRHIGKISGKTSGSGYIVLPSNPAFDNFYITSDGCRLPKSLRIGSEGLGIGADPIANGINIAKDIDDTASINISGTNCFNLKIDKTVQFSGRYINGNIYTFEDGDTTPSVAGSNIFKTNNSSATSITTFDDGVKGQKIVVIFTDNNTTIVNGSGIYTKSGTDETPSANTAMEFVYDGTYWYEV